MSQKEYSVVKSTRKTLVYAAAAQEVEIGRFPAGTQLVTNITVDEAFNNANTLSVGTNATFDNLVSALNVTTLTGINGIRRVVTTDTARIVTAKIPAAATAGAATVTIDYILPTSQEVSY